MVKFFKKIENLKKKVSNFFFFEPHGKKKWEFLHNISKVWGIWMFWTPLNNFLKKVVPKFFSLGFFNKWYWDYGITYYL